MNFKSWLVISEMARSPETLKKYLETNSLQALSQTASNPDKARYKFLISEWDGPKNKKELNLTPSDITIGNSNQKINWKCIKKKHTWAARISDRTYSGHNCPCCSNQQVCKDNNLQALSKTAEDPYLKARYKRLVSEWDGPKNKKEFNLTASDITPGSRQKINWKCKEGHTWPAELSDRTKGSNCPDCSPTNKRVSKDYSLQALSENLPESDLKSKYKRLVSEWDYGKDESGKFKNKKDDGEQLLPKDVTPVSGKKVNWKCLEKKHTWKIRVSDRAYGSNCPCCSNQQVCIDNNLQALSENLPESDLKARYQRLVSEWDYGKDESGKFKNKKDDGEQLLPKDVVSGSEQKIIWKCEKGHRWLTSLNNRKNGSNCPVCNQSRGEEETYRILQKYISSTQITRQFKDENCRGDCSLLSFDFIVEINRKKYFIEYNGEQHYKPTFGSTPEKRQYRFEKNQRYDKIKLDYCRSKNIPFLVIPYTQYKNIDTIISSFLKTKTFDSKFAELRL